MGYIVQNRIELSLAINGVEYPLNIMNVLNFLQISAGASFKLPMIHFSVKDVTGILTRNNMLADGVSLSVTIKALGSTESVTYNFRKANMDKRPDGDSYVFEVDGYLDAPKYFIGTSSAGFRGTSNDCLQSIAETCGLQFDGIQTSDSQLWMQKNQPYADFAWSVTDHGYISDTSFMSQCVDFDKTLRYKNINALPPAQKQLVAKKTETGKITVVDYGGCSNSGFSNKNTGYALGHTYQTLTGSTEHEQYNELAFTPDSRSPAFNPELKTMIGRGLQQFGPISVGNNHDAYDKAHYQNLRYNNLFGQTTEMIIQVPTGIKLFDKINFSAELDDGRPDDQYSGEYTVVTRAIRITGSNYIEKLECVRHGTNLTQG